MLHLRRLAKPTLELDDIQAIVLRPRPAPYFGTHALLEITEAAAGCEAIRRLRGQVTAAVDWHRPAPAWTTVALTYQGLRALQTPAASLASFPRAFCEGMAARADRLRDTGPNHPSRWHKPFGTGRVHLAVSVVAQTEVAWRAEVLAYEN